MVNRVKLLAVVCISMQLLVGTGVFGQPSKTSSYANPCATNKKYIVFNDSSRSFLEAWRFCLGLGMRLATITSTEDSRLVEEAIRRSSNPIGPWWIGGTDLGMEGQYVWISTNSFVGSCRGFFNFYANQPDNKGGNEHCLEIGRWGGVAWNDGVCDTKQRFICETSQ